MYKDVLNDAVETWGIQSQVSMVIEEMAELIVELNKYYFRRKLNRKSRLIEEVADCELMLTQIRYILASDKQIDECKKFKIERLKGRIAKAKGKSNRVLFKKQPLQTKNSSKQKKIQKKRKAS